MEGEFMKMPDGKKGNTFLRKKKGLLDDKFENIKKDWENREIIKGEGDSASLLKKHEIKKTQEQREMFELVVEEVNKVLKKYSESDARAKEEFIRLVDPDFFDVAGIKNALGVYVEYLHVAAINFGKNTTKTMASSIAFHELMHMFSFNRRFLAGGTKKGYALQGIERSGVSVASDNEEKRYLFFLNEAITSRLTENFFETLRENKFFKDEMWELKKNVKGYSKKDSPIFAIHENSDGNLEPTWFTQYPEDMETFDQLIDELYEKNKHKFKTRDEVFDLFAKAYFSGKLLDIARLIEKTLGKGTFRKLAEKTQFKRGDKPKYT